MKSDTFENLTDQELIKEAQSRKSQTYISAVLIGFMLGIAVYSAVRNGFGFFTFFPLFFIPIFAGASKKHKAVKVEMQKRGLDGQSES